MGTGNAERRSTSCPTDRASAAPSGHAPLTEPSHPGHAPVPSSAARVLGAAGGALTGVLLAAVSAARRAKAVHPHGESFLAELSVPGVATAPAGSQLLRT